MPHNDSGLGESSRFLLGQLVAGQKAMQGQLEDFIKTSRKTDEGHDDRLTSLETDRAKTIGIASTISALIAALGMWWGGSK